MAMSGQTDRSKVTQAPGALGVIEAFVNTRYGAARRYHEEMETPQDVRDWLARHGLLADDAPVSEGDARRARSAREAIRTLLRANTPAATPRRRDSAQRQPAQDRPREDASAETARERQDEARDILNTLAANAPLVVRFHGAGETSLEPDIAGVDGALARLLAAIALAQADGSWRLLKICGNEACSMAFYDTSKNHSGVWCAMSGCGNRLNARASRARRRERQP